MTKTNFSDPILLARIASKRETIRVTDQRIGTLEKQLRRAHGDTRRALVELSGALAYRSIQVVELGELLTKVAA